MAAPTTASAAPHSAAERWDDMEPFDHEPGNPEAIAAGCSCPPQDGPGMATAPDGRPGYLCDQHCPLHGIEVIKRVLAAGGGEVIGEAESDNDEDEPTVH